MDSTDTMDTLDMLDTMDTTDTMDTLDIVDTMDTENLSQLSTKTRNSQQEIKTLCSSDWERWMLTSMLTSFCPPHWPLIAAWQLPMTWPLQQLQQHSPTWNQSARRISVVFQQKLILKQFSVERAKKKPTPQLPKSTSMLTMMEKQIQVMEPVVLPRLHTEQLSEREKTQSLELLWLLSITGQELRMETLVLLLE